jgi:hypothetical protein
VLRVSYLLHDDSLGGKSDYCLPDKIPIGFLQSFKFAATKRYKIIHTKLNLFYSSVIEVQQDA